VPDTLVFTIPDKPNVQLPLHCSLCAIKPAWLEYEIDSDEPSFHQLSGSCCLGCAGNLLAGLEKLCRARHEKSPQEGSNFSAN